MNKLSKFKKTNIFLLLALSFTMLNSCSSTIALYDQFAYTQATSLKVDMQNLAKESSTTNFSDAKTDIDNLNVALQKAHEYVNGISKNSLATQQYSILLSDNGFYKTFLKTWESQGKESPTAADEISTKIGQLMDQIIALESGKNKSKS